MEKQTKQTESLQVFGLDMLFLFLIFFYCLSYYSFLTEEAEVDEETCLDLAIDGGIFNFCVTVDVQIK